MRGWTWKGVYMGGPGFDARFRSILFCYITGRGCTWEGVYMGEGGSGKVCCRQVVPRRRLASGAQRNLNVD